MTTRRTTTTTTGGKKDNTGGVSQDSDPAQSAGDVTLRARMLSGCAGAIVTALAVTPLDVVKVRQQAAAVEDGTTQSVKHNKRVRGSPAVASPCPRGCFVLNNGLMECVVAKNSVPYFYKEALHLVSCEASLMSSSSVRVSRTHSPSVASRVAHIPANVPRHAHSYQRKGLMHPKRAATSARSAAAAAAAEVVGSRKAALSNDTFATLWRIFRHEGMGGLYAGLAPTLVMSVPSTVLYFTAYEELSNRLKRWHTLRDSATAAPWWIPLASGSIARLVATMVTSPLELMRTQQAMNRASASASAWTLSSLYRGLYPTLWRDVPFSAIYWFCVEDIRTRLQRACHARDLPISTHVAISFVSGAVGGMIAAACTTPFDVIKTRQQIELYTGRPQHGVWHQMYTVVQNQGWAELWRGNTARIIKVAPACAIMISSFEWGKRIFA